MRILRSLLFTPGNRPKLLEKAPSTGADALIFDLEDSVPLAQKAEARAISREYLDRLKRQCVIHVRVNPLESGLLRDDLEAVMVDGLATVKLPKVSSAEAVRTVDALMAEIEQARGLPVGGIDLDVTLESAFAIEFAYDILSAAGRVGAVTVSTSEDGDLHADLGIFPGPGGLELLYVRSRVVVAARAAGIVQLRDGVYTNMRDEAGLVDEAQAAKRLGYHGKHAIHPAQVEPINRVFTPTAKEIDYYQRVVTAYEAAVAQGSASTAVDGKMIDHAMMVNARRVLAWAESVGAR